VRGEALKNLDELSAVSPRVAKITAEMKRRMTEMEELENVVKSTTDAASLNQFEIMGRMKFLQREVEALSEELQEVREEEAEAAKRKAREQSAARKK
jgi:predicted  nucleic acid-binding Zn-ribbon protein